MKSILGNAVFLNVTYGNGTEISDFDMDIGTETSVTLRILYNYFINGNENQSFIKFRDVTVSKRKEDRNIEKIAIIVGIDEINKVYEKN
ncbi:hypothetical protein GLOIN_2v1668084 [Rhizophagus clarus]|uniref:Uncharacterized protein n=1 Tax=Rhizophagus clarus TaxID=94130 RepID=A0A8H3QMI9_9GLOM|nr:hypothetical protein GLOIN_2v1668084 [Rhizophagus clarus]